MVLAVPPIPKILAVPPVPKVLPVPKVPPVRWYHLLSTWIFLLSAAYPLLKIPTFPLNLLAFTGCLEIILNPHKSHWVKNLYILFIHIAPFFWIPRDLSMKAFGIGICVIGAYLMFVASIGENPMHIYDVLLNEDHPRLSQFLQDRFSL
jgi:hypothetical protein